MRLGGRFGKNSGFAPEHCAFSPPPLLPPTPPRGGARRDAHGARCEINDAAQLGVINRGIIMVAIINIASLVCDNRSCQVTKLRLK